MLEPTNVTLATVEHLPQKPFRMLHIAINLVNFPIILVFLISNLKLIKYKLRNVLTCRFTCE